MAAATKTSIGLFDLDRVRSRGPDRQASSHVVICWAMLSTALAAFILKTSVEAVPLLIDHVLAFASAVTCGLAWLLARSLFRNDDELSEIWPAAAVGGLFGLILIGRYYPNASILGLDLVEAVVALGSSAFLVLALLEPFIGFRRELSPTERRFRVSFASGYALILFAGVILIEASQDASSLRHNQAIIHVGCAALALLGGTCSARFRYRSLVAESVKHTSTISQMTADDRELGDKIWQMLVDDKLYLDPDLRVDDLAAFVCVPSYRVSRAVNTGLGFGNFNQMVNSLRLKEARRSLIDPARASCSIMTIAFDSGFASIGPFNRCFKNEFGLTPKQYRLREIVEPNDNP